MEKHGKSSIKDKTFQALEAVKQNHPKVRKLKHEKIKLQYAQKNIEMVLKIRGNMTNVKINSKQARTELGQAQLKLRLYYALIICRFGFYRFSLLNFVGWILFLCLIGRFNFVESVMWIWFSFKRFGFIDCVSRFGLVYLL